MSTSNIVSATPRVVHLKREPHDVRIDRQTHWGNPFVIGKDGTREQVIAKYRAWLLEQPWTIELAKRDLKGKTLGCWCAPKACHGDVLLEIANDWKCLIGSKHGEATAPACDTYPRCICGGPEAT